MGSKWGYQEQKGGEFVKIDKLTDEQKSQMIEHRDNWIAIGLETKPANRSLAEIAVADMYRLGGLPPPARIVWCGSPLSNVLTWASVWASVRDSVGDSVYWGFGQHDANWLAFYDYFLNEHNLDSCKKLIPLMELAKHCNWYLPFKNICIISNKPKKINLVNNRLHADGQPALEYRDGFAIWALNGVRVSKEIAETPAEKLNPELLFKEKNAEVRREIIRKIGYDILLHKLNAKKIDIDNDNELFEIENADVEPIRLLKVKCFSTGVNYVLRIPPQINKCEQARLWTMGIEDNQEAVEIIKET